MKNNDNQNIKDTIYWNCSQKMAIESRDKNVLVSAAAGSGKTAVLTQRIIELVSNDNVDIDSILILTFTKAAANEMKSRIQKELYKKMKQDIENEHIKNQISLLSQASISTMHSFCIDVIRENFNVIDIDPNLSIANSTVINILKKESIEEIFEKKFEEENKKFLELVDIFVNKSNYSNFIKIIYNIHTFIQSKAKPTSWLFEQVEKYNVNENDDNIYLTRLNEFLQYKIAFIQKNIDDALKICQENSLAYEETLLKDKDDVNTMHSLITKDYDEFCEYIKNYKINSLSRKKDNGEFAKDYKELVKEIRNKHIKSQGIEILKKFDTKKEEYIDKMKKTYPLLSELANIVEEFDTLYKQKKIEKNLLDFNDLEHFVLKILENEDAKKRLQLKYKYIFYDEYQDSNEVQDKIIEGVSSNDNLFFVGDVKQSIYGFRLANPDIFIEKYNKYKNGEKGQKIDLSENFRSSKQVLDFCNLIFENIMNVESCGIQYDENAKLKTKKNEEFKEENIQINLIKNKNEKSENIYEDDEQINLENNSNENNVSKSKSSLEKATVKNSNESEDDSDTLDLEDDEIVAEITAKQILKIINEKNGQKPIEFKDIVILKRSIRNSVSTYAKVFRKYKIPLFIDYSEAFFEVVEVSIFIDFLKIIDNIRQDEPLISVLLSSIGNFDINEISKIKIFDIKEKFFHRNFLNYMTKMSDDLSEKIKTFVSKINIYNDLEKYMSLDEFVDYVMIDSNYKDYVRNMVQGQARLQNLDIVSQKASEFMQNENKSLFYFLKYIDSILTSKTDDLEPKIISKEENLVRFMTIHKSKGLEFEVVILNDIQKKFNFSDQKSSIVLDTKQGIGIDFVDLQEGYCLETLPKKIIKIEKHKQELAEEIRIFYVALTRAKSRLILNALVNDKVTDNLKKSKDGENVCNIENSKSYLDFVMYTINEDSKKKNNEIKTNNEKLYQISEIDAKKIVEIFDEEGDFESEFNQILAKTTLTDEEKTKIFETLDYTYKYKNDLDRQIKNSVTSISKQNNIYKIENILDYNELNNKKSFDSAKIGTINHLFLQNIDFKKDYDMQSLEKLKESLVEKYFITKEESELINIENAYNLIKSDFGQRIKNADKIYKEESFLMNYNDTILSGIVDLFYEENGKIVVVDYKTDNVNKETANMKAEQYKNQIYFYKEAIKKSFGKDVKESYIYFLNIGKYVSIE